MTFPSPYLLLIVATLLWGGNFVVGAQLVRHIPPLTLSLLRWSVALAVVWPLFGADVWAHRKHYARHWKTVLALSLTGVAAFNSLVYVSVQYTTPVNASLMNAATPIMIVLLSLACLREPLTATRTAGIAISLCGVLWILSRGSWEAVASLSFNPGDLWMLAAIAAWAVYSILVKATSGLFPPNGAFAVTVLAAVALLLPCAAAEWAVGRRPTGVTWADGAGVLYIGVFASIAAFLSWNRAVSVLGPSRCASFLNLIPLFSAALAAAFASASVEPYHAFGAALVIGGITLASRSKPKPATQP